jgi:hypothetical protein
MGAVFRVIISLWIVLPQTSHPPGIHLGLARIHADSGRWDDAAREVQRELALVPDSAAALDLKARVGAAAAKR